MFPDELVYTKKDKLYMHEYVLNRNTDHRTIEAFMVPDLRAETHMLGPNQNNMPSVELKCRAWYEEGSRFLCIEAPGIKQTKDHKYYLKYDSLPLSGREVER